MSNTNNTLLIDTSPIKDFLTFDGELVWTVKNQDELNALRKLVKVFGSTIKNVQGKDQSLVPGNEEVIGFGKDTHDAGLLYAHLTRRNFRYAESIEEITKGKAPAIVIVDPQLLDADLLELLYKPSAGTTVPGIIFSEDPKELRKQVLIRTAAAQLSGKIESDRIDLHPILDFGQRTKPGYQLLGGTTDPKEIRTALASGAGLLLVSTHSDGIDAKMGKDLTLCPMDVVQTNSNLFFSPVCFATQFCHRHTMSMQEFLRSDHFLSPEDIAAQIFILNGCQGLLLRSSLIDLNWSFAKRFSNSSSLGAIVTTWETVISIPNQTIFLAQNILNGMPVGKAVAIFNKSPEAKIFGRNRMCLLGDPRVTLPAKSGKSGLPDRSKTSPKVEDKTNILKLLGKNKAAQAEFFDICFSLLLKQSTYEDELFSVKDVLAKMRLYQKAVKLKSPKSEIDSHLDEMLTAILNHLNKFTQSYSTWLGLVNKFSTYTSAEKCEVCSQRLSITKVTLKFFSIFHRKLVMCPNCGIIKDSPFSMKLDLVLIGRNLQLRGKLPRKKCKAKVLYEHANIESSGETWEWELDKKEGLNFELPYLVSPSFVTITVVVVWSDGYVVLKNLTRAFQQKLNR